MRALFITIFALCLIADNTFSQTKVTENIFVFDDNTKSEPISLDAFSWLEGTWHGEALGGTAEETWSAESGNAMMGMFRLISADNPLFYEFFILAEEENSAVLKLKHFEPDMRGWEEKDEFESFRFIRADGNKFYFDGLTMINISTEETTVIVAMSKQDRSVEELVFNYTRKN